MKREIILAGVGGQGLLTLAAVISQAAMDQELFVKQSEVHGMSQRGGAVKSHVRISDRTIHSPVIPKGKANLILAMEPLEALRYLEHLAPDGAVVTNSVPVRNIADYPDEDKLLGTIRALPQHLMLDAVGIARELGSLQSANMVLLGAGAKFIGLPESALEQAITALFVGKSSEIAALNLEAFRRGRTAAA